MLPPTREPRAFTLVELLVVIGIIALLIAILLPALSKARQASLTLKCLTVQRAMAQAAIAHAQEHRGILPLAGAQISDPGDPTDYVTPEGMGDPGRQKYVYCRQTTGVRPGVDRPAPLPAVLAPYLGASVDLGSSEELVASLNSDAMLRLVVCPAQDPATITPTLSVWGQYWIDGPPVRMGYIFNGSILWLTPLASKQSQHLCIRGHLAAIRHPDQVFLFADGRPDGGPGNRANPGYQVWGPNNVGDPIFTTYTLQDSWWINGITDSRDFTIKPGTDHPLNQFDPGRHQGKINIVFVDGHAETLNFPTRRVSEDTPTDLQRAGISKGISQ